MEHILAHISAPAKRKDDDKYRAQLSALIAFRPGKRIRIAHSEELVSRKGGAQHRNECQDEKTASSSVVETRHALGARVLETHALPENASETSAVPSSLRETSRKISAIDAHLRSSRQALATPTSSRQSHAKVRLREQNDSPVFYDNTQDAFISLESQLIPEMTDTQADPRSSSELHSDQLPTRSSSPIDQRSVVVQQEQMTSDVIRLRVQTREGRADPSNHRSSPHGLTSQLPLSLESYEFDVTSPTRPLTDTPRWVSNQHEAVGIQPDISMKVSGVGQRRLSDPLKGTPYRSIDHLNNERYTNVITVSVAEKEVAVPDAVPRSLNTTLVPSSALLPVVLAQEVVDQNSGFDNPDTKSDDEKTDSGLSRSEPVPSVRYTEPSRSDGNRNIFANVPILVLSPLPATSMPSKQGYKKAELPWPPLPTQRLQDLQTNADLREVYQPTSINNDVDMSTPGLRGYWSFETSSWDIKLQLVFWTSLTEFVSKGWGSDMRIRRGRSHSDTDNVSSHELGHVDVWCWAGLVEHTYLLLYSFSDSRIARTGAKWFTGPRNVLAIIVDPRPAWRRA